MQAQKHAAGSHQQPQQQPAQQQHQQQQQSQKSQQQHQQQQQSHQQQYQQPPPPSRHVSLIHNSSSSSSSSVAQQHHNQPYDVASRLQSYSGNQQQRCPSTLATTMPTISLQQPPPQQQTNHSTNASAAAAAVVLPACTAAGVSSAGAAATDNRTGIPAKKCHETGRGSSSSSSDDSDSDSDSSDSSSSTTSDHNMGRNRSGDGSIAAGATKKEKKTEKAPQFSVKQSDTGGLRMKFAIAGASSAAAAASIPSNHAAKHSHQAPAHRNHIAKSSRQTGASHKAPGSQLHGAAKTVTKPIVTDDATSSSCCSACSETDSDTSDSSASPNIGQPHASSPAKQPSNAVAKVRLKSTPTKQQQQRLVRKTSGVAKAARNSSKDILSRTGRNSAALAASATMQRILGASAAAQIMATAASSTAAAAAASAAAATSSSTSADSDSSSSSSSSNNTSSSSGTDRVPNSNCPGGSGGNKAKVKKPHSMTTTTTTTTSKMGTTLTKLTITTTAGQPPKIRIPMPEHLVDGTDGASSSDMELPALVNAAIQRVESVSDDGDSLHRGSGNGGRIGRLALGGASQYRSTLLQDFCAKAQMMQDNSSSNGGSGLTMPLAVTAATVAAAAAAATATSVNNNTTLAGKPLPLTNNSTHEKTEPLSSSAVAATAAAASLSASMGTTKRTPTTTPTTTALPATTKRSPAASTNPIASVPPTLTTAALPQPVTMPVVKRKRGRPRKVPLPTAATVEMSSIVLPSESPDSGITSTPHSPMQAGGFSSDRGTPSSQLNADVRPTAATATTAPLRSGRPAKKVRTNKAAAPTPPPRRASPLPPPPALPSATSTTLAPKTAPTVPASPSSVPAAVAPKLNLTSLEKSIYATERVLYPPRRRKRAVSVAPAKTGGGSSSSSSARHHRNGGGGGAATPAPPSLDDLLDPTWQRIDINKKFRRPSTSGYRSDGGVITGTVCSKVLAAVGTSRGGGGQSGYKSDYSCRSRRSSIASGRSRCSKFSSAAHYNDGYKSGDGYKSDFSVRAKSCGYRSDAGSRMRRVRRKRRTKTSATNASGTTTTALSSRSPGIDLDILQLAGLSLGQSEESSRDSVNTTPDVPAVVPAGAKKTTKSNAATTTAPAASKRSKTTAGSISGSPRSTTTTSRKFAGTPAPVQRQRTLSTSSGREILSNLCERVTKRLSSAGGLLTANSPGSSGSQQFVARLSRGRSGSPAPLVLVQRPGSIRCRRASAVSHCSSRASGTSSHHRQRQRRHRQRRRLKSRCRMDPAATEAALSKINLQVEMLVGCLRACRIEGPTTTTKQTPAAAESTTTTTRLKGSAVLNNNNPATAIAGTNSKTSAGSTAANSSSGSSASLKRVQKKRKASESVAHHQHHLDGGAASSTASTSASTSSAATGGNSSNAAATPSAASTSNGQPAKRGRGKKAQSTAAASGSSTGGGSQTQSPDDHKLPLKKRHYLLTPDGKHIAALPNGNGATIGVLGAELSDGHSIVSVDERIRLHQEQLQHQLSGKQSATAALSVNVSGSSSSGTPKKRVANNNVSPAGTAAAAGPSVLSVLSPAAASTRSAAQAAQSPLSDAANAAAASTLAAAATTPSTHRKNSDLARKKNRLEGLLSKISPSPVPCLSPLDPMAGIPVHIIAKSGPAAASAAAAASTTSSRSSVIRSITNASAMNVPPPGVFEPTVDLELQIPAIVTKTEIDSPRTAQQLDTLARLVKDEPSALQQQQLQRLANGAIGAGSALVVESLLNKTGGNLLLKRKRKKANRTGFPTVRRKKKKPNVAQASPTAAESKATTASTEEIKPLVDSVATDGQDVPPSGDNNIDRKTAKTAGANCDRVPLAGEPAATFIERHSRPRLSVVSLERLQGKVESSPSPLSASVEKRVRDSSGDSSIPLSKRFKLQSEPLEAPSPTMTDKSWPSDNEPLIRLVTKRGRKKGSLGAAKRTSAAAAAAAESADGASVQQLVKNPFSKRSRKNGELSSSSSSTTSKHKRHADSPNTIRHHAVAEASVSRYPLVKLKQLNATQLANHAVVTKAETTDPKRNAAKRAPPRLNGDATAPEDQHSVQLVRNPVSAARKTKKSQGNSAECATPPPPPPTTTTTATTTEKSKRGRKPGSTSATTAAVPSIADDSTADDYADADIKPFDPSDHPEHEPLPLPQNDGRTASETTESATDSETSHRKISRLKRKYLVAGLFSDYYKQPSDAVGPTATTTTTRTPTPSAASDRPASSQSRTSSQLDASETNESGVTTDAPIVRDQIDLLPAPAYCEAHFRRTVIDYQLPYDLWWAHRHNKLPGRQHIVPSWNYKKIRTNVYLDVRPPVQSTEDHQVCSCKPPTECGDDCLNRLMYTECSPKTCPCAERCRNTDIQRHNTAPGVERFMTADKGWGVRTKQPIRKGIYILEYVGEVVTEREFKQRMATVYTQDTHHYCLNLDGGLVIDGHRMGSDGRFVNHACAPNCEMQKWSVNGLFRMALFALRDIRPDEELTYDYNFALFNPAEGQPCRCGALQCRGVIGGKSQRVKPLLMASGGGADGGVGADGAGVAESGRGADGAWKASTKSKTGRPRKNNKANKNASFMHSKQRRHLANYVAPTSKEMCFVRNGNCFLSRNIRKVRRSTRKPQPPTPTILTAQISALRQPRNIRTRGISIAEHDPVIEKTARIAGILREICQELAAHRVEAAAVSSTNSSSSSTNTSATTSGTASTATAPAAAQLLALPSRKRQPAYYERIVRPIDLAVIEANVEKGTYQHPSLFDEDVRRWFANTTRFYTNGSGAEMAAVDSLTVVYARKKEQCAERLAQIVPAASLAGFWPPNRPVSQLMTLRVDPNEDIIRCVCGLFVDEGVMIQCAKCLVWQHTQCTGADTLAESYLCEQCDPAANLSREIRLEGETNVKGLQCYLSLVRGDLQVRQTDTVYVLRDIPIEPPASDADEQQPPPSATPPIRKHTYETIGSVDFSECDIFRIEQLWKDADGRRFVYGHHYLRPHETYHEPTRKFYQNEVMRVPLYEEVPIEMIMGRCWVLDPTTFCKGRPVDSVEEHVYICELRVDKAARSFARIGKNQYPVCQKSYAFQRFEQKLKIQRNYMPHDVSLVPPKQTQPNRKKKTDDTTTTAGNNSASSLSGALHAAGRKHATQVVQLQPIPPKTLNERRGRLEAQLARLATRLPALAEDEQPINLSYLLTGRGTRRRTNANASLAGDSH